jgi:hypothetical protein
LFTFPSFDISWFYKTVDFDFCFEIVQAIGCWLLAVGDWRLAIGIWRFAIGFWHLAFGIWRFGQSYAFGRTVARPS